MHDKCTESNFIDCCEIKVLMKHETFLFPSPQTQFFVPKLLFDCFSKVKM